MEYLTSVGQFFSRWVRYAWPAFALVVLDLSDLWSRFVQPHLPAEWHALPDVLARPVVVLVLAWSAVHVFHQQRLQLLSTQEELGLERDRRPGIAIDGFSTIPAMHNRTLVRMKVRNDGREAGTFRARGERPGREYVLPPPLGSGRRGQQNPQRACEEFVWRRGGLGESYIAVGETDILELIEVSKSKYGWVYWLRIPDENGRVQSYWLRDYASNGDGTFTHELITLRVTITSVPTAREVWTANLKLGRDGYSVVKDDGTLLYET